MLLNLECIGVSGFLIQQSAHLQTPTALYVLLIRDLNALSFSAFPF